MRHRPDTDDGRRDILTPGAKPFGEEVFGAAAQNAKNIRLEGKSEIEEIQIFGDWTFLRSHIKVATVPTFCQPVRRSGHTLTILRKEADGEWCLAHDANLLTGEKAR